MSSRIDEALNGSGFPIVPAKNLSVVRCYCESLADRFASDQNINTEERFLRLVPISNDQIDSYLKYDAVPIEYAIACMNTLRGMPPRTILLFKESKDGLESEWLYIANRSYLGSDVEDNHMHYLKDFGLCENSHVFVIAFA